MATINLDTLPEESTIDRTEKVPILKAGAWSQVPISRINHVFEVTDETDPQTIIDALSASGGGRLHVHNNITRSTSLELKPNVQLDMNAGISLDMTGIDNAIVMYPGAQILSANIILSNTSITTQAGILLDGGNGPYLRSDHTYLNNIKITGPTTTGSQKGYGIYAKSSGTNTYVEWISANNLMFLDLDIAVYFQANGISGSFVNGNIFSGILIDKCDNGILLDGASSGVNAVAQNIFNGIQWETSSLNPTSLIKIKGNRNMFNLVSIWDWDAQTRGPSVQILEGSMNIVEGSAFTSIHLSDTSGQTNLFGQPTLTTQS